MPSWIAVRDIIELKEQEKALMLAGIDPDPTTWTEKDLRKAEAVLDELERRAMIPAQTTN